jgi:hypothetical protein
MKRWGITRGCRSYLGGNSGGGGASEALRRAGAGSAQAGRSRGDRRAGRGDGDRWLERRRRRHI